MKELFWIGLIYVVAGQLLIMWCTLIDKLFFPAEIPKQPTAPTN